MKKLVVIVFSLIFNQALFAQWQMMNSPLATPEIKLVASHPDGYVFAITNQNEVFRKDTSGNQWNKISVLDSTAYCIAISPDGIIYTGTKGGYFYSSDYGNSWIAKRLLVPNAHSDYVSDIGFGTQGYIYMTSYGGTYSGVWVSSDNGINWNKYTNGLTDYLFIGLEIDSIGNIYVLSINGSIFKSTDQGLNWEFRYSFQTTSFSLKIDNSNNLYFASNIGIYKSSDAGNNWTLVYHEIGGIKKIFSNNNNIYAIRGADKGIIYSTDTGINWENIGLVGYFPYDLIPVDNTIYTATRKGLQETTDLGNIWALSFKYDDKFVKVNDVFIFDDKTFVSSNQGVFISSNNGVNWLETSLTENSRMVRNDHLGNLYAASDSLYKSTNSGEYWFKTNISYAPVVKMFINDSGYIFIGEGDCCNCEIVVQSSIDQGNTWNYLFGLLGVSDICQKVYELVQSPSGSLFISYREWGFYHPGNIWIDNRVMRKYPINSNWGYVIQDKIVQSICFNDSTMYLATQEEGIYKSFDEGYTLIPMNSGLTSNDIRQIIKTPEEVLICLASDGVFRSLDNGNHWASLGINGLLSTAINSIYYNNGILYACTNNGIGVFIGELPVELTSFNASITQNKVQLNWETATELNNNGFEVQRKLENADWITIGFVQANGTTTEPRSYTYLDDVSDFISNKIYYRLKQIDYNGNYEFSDEIEVITLPLEYSLSQNYPNPFNPTTKIKYEIPENTNVKIEVYNILGDRITTLVNEEKPAGRYEAEFDGSILASGVYIYKLQAGDFVSSKKMILLK